MTTFLQRLALLLAVVSQLVLGTGRGMVLCMEADGSIRLELTSLSCCEPESIHDLHEGGAGAPGEDSVCSDEDGGCGRCIDRDLQVAQVPKVKHSPPPLTELVQADVPILDPTRVADAPREERILRPPPLPRAAPPRAPPVVS